MPITLTPCPHPPGVIVELIGSLSGDEIIATNAGVAELADCTFQLWNYLGVTQLDISPEQMHIIAAQDGAIAESSALKKIAVVGRREVFHGLDKIYHVFSEKWVGRRRPFESKTFDSLQAAWAWLDPQHAHRVSEGS